MSHTDVGVSYSKAHCIRVMKHGYSFHFILPINCKLMDKVVL